MVDGLSVIINSLDIEIITIISQILDSTIIYGLLIALLVLIFERDNHKRTKIFTALGLALLVAVSLKTITHIDRPCDVLILKTECDDAFSFPSIHAVIAFVLAVSFIDTSKYKYFLLFALFVSFSRIYLGVHTFIDVSASLAISPIVYGVVDWFWRKEDL